MSNYGRNFEFLVPPQGNQRQGRYYNAEGAEIPIGVPVEVDTGTDDNDLDMQAVVLATGATATPDNGQGGIVVYEYGPAGYAGDDPFLTDYSDKDVVPDGAAVQVVHGDTVKVRFKNTVASTFLNTRDYAGRIMVAGLQAATPTVAVGEYLTPGTGDDTSGYWAEDADVANAWLVITSVDADRDELEARMTF